MSERPTKLSPPKDIRIYAVDEAEIKNLHDLVYKDTNLSMLDIIRDSIHVGLPLIVKRLRPLAKAGKDQA